MTFKGTDTNIPQYSIWTESAKACYRINCECWRCQILGFKFEYLRPANCKMYLAVKQLVEKIGKPEE